MDFHVIDELASRLNNLLGQLDMLETLNEAVQFDWTIANVQEFIHTQQVRLEQERIDVMAKMRDEEAGVIEVLEPTPEEEGVISDIQPED